MSWIEAFLKWWIKDLRFSEDFSSVMGEDRICFFLFTRIFDSVWSSDLRVSISVFWLSRGKEK